MDAYGELCTLFYELDKPGAPELALEWYGNALRAHLDSAHRRPDAEASGYGAQRHGFGRIVEPMCGSGRFLLPLIERGLSVDGFDPSKPMLDACRAKLGVAGLDARLWRQGLEDLDLGQREYTGAFIPASSFCLITNKESARRGLLRLREHLSPAALLLIEFELPHPAVNWPTENTRTITDGGRQIRLTSRAEYDLAEQIETHTNHYELKQSGKVVATEDEVLRLRCYAPDEMRALLESAGFKDISIEHPEFGWVAKAYV